MEDWKATIHDCYYEVKGYPPFDKELYKILESIPNDIKLLAEQWGWNDTEVGDKIYRYLKEN